MTLSKTRLVVIVILAMFAGWFINDALSPTKSRPILNLLKRFWWVPLVLDEPQACHTHDHQEGEVVIGSDGYPLVDHRRAF